MIKTYFETFPISIINYYRHKWAWYGLSITDKLVLKIFFGFDTKIWDDELK